MGHHAVQRDGTDGGQSLGGRDVVDVPDIRGAAGSGCQPETQEHGWLTRIGGQGQSRQDPARRGSAVRRDERPIGAVVSRSFHVHIARGVEGVIVGEAEYRVDRTEKTHGGGEGERLAGDAAGVTGPGRVLPGVGWGNGGIGGQGPRCVGHPITAAGFRIIQEGVIHPDRGGGGDDTAEGEELAHVHYYNLIIVHCFGRGREVHERSGVLPGDRADQNSVVPRLPGRQGSVNAVGRKISDIGGGPIQGDGVGGDRGGRGGQGRGRIADMYVVHVPTGLDHRGVGDQVEARPEGRGGAPGGEIELLLGPVRIGAGERSARDREPGGPAVSAALDVEEIVTVLDIVFAPKVEHGVGHSRQAERRNHGHDHVGVVGVIGAGVGGSLVGGRDGGGGGEPPGTGAAPIGESGLEIVMEIEIGRVGPGQGRVIGDGHHKTAEVARERRIPGHGPTEAQELGDHPVGNGWRLNSLGSQHGVLDVHMRSGARHAGAEGRHNRQGVKRIDAESVGHRHRRPVVGIAGLGDAHGHHATPREGKIGSS